MDVDTLAREAARLPVAVQHALLDRIVDALASTAERQVSEAWDAEIARRVEDLDAGRAAPVPWTEGRRRLRARCDDAVVRSSQCRLFGDGVQVVGVAQGHRAPRYRRDR